MQRGCVHVQYIYGQLYGWPYVCLPSHSNSTRDNLLLLCGADMIEELENSCARVLASAYDAYEE